MKPLRGNVMGVLQEVTENSVKGGLSDMYTCYCSYIREEGLRKSLVKSSITCLPSIFHSYVHGWCMAWSPWPFPSGA